LAAERDDEERFIPDSWKATDAAFDDAEELFDALLRWKASRAGSNFRLQYETSHDQYMSSCWDDLTESFDDPRFELSLLLSRTRNDTLVTLDLTDLLLGGWLEPDELPHRTARERLANDVSASGPVIVVTEGRTDARLLSRATSLAAPELRDSFSFLDFDGTSTPGGVDRVVSLTRGLAAAGVMNRVISVFDNDIAGRIGAEILRKSTLPKRTTVTLLPDVPYARRYPTRGPHGEQHTDVNGRAVAIEMMFGVSIMKAANAGQLPAVRWLSYNNQLNDYQGAVESKGNIQTQLTKALAVTSLEQLHPEVARGCRRMAAMLIEAAAEATPALASEFSPLLSHRAREGRRGAEEVSG
jgi:hypothetical protein